MREPDGWLAYFCTKPQASPEEVLEAVADRGAIEQAFEDVKEEWGRGSSWCASCTATRGAST